MMKKYNKCTWDFAKLRDTYILAYNKCAIIDSRIICFIISEYLLINH